MINLVAMVLACSCAEPPPVLLKYDAVGVPTNVVLWGRYPNLAAAKRVTLVRAADQSNVALVVTEGPIRELFRFTPEVPLDAQTRYEINFDGRSELPFTTGEGEDHDPPEAVTLGGLRYSASGAGSSCGETRTWTLDVEGGRDDVTPRDELLLLVRTGDGSAGALVTLRRPQLSTGMCSTNFDEKAGTYVHDVQLMDLAGNVATKAPQRSRLPFVAVVFVLVAAGVFWRMRRKIA